MLFITASIYTGYQIYNGEELSTTAIDPSQRPISPLSWLKVEERVSIPQPHRGHIEMFQCEILISSSRICHEVYIVAFTGDKCFETGEN